MTWRKALWVLPWAVVVSTRAINCQYVIDAKDPTSGTMTQQCDRGVDHQLTYRGNVLAYCGPDATSPELRDHCEWMNDVAAGMNDVAIKRGGDFIQHDPDDSVGKDPALDTRKVYRVEDDENADGKNP